MSAAGASGRAREVLVVGSGIAGLTCALDLVAAGADVTLVTRGALGGGSTAWAQGGIAAVVPDPGAEILTGGDSVAQHVADTLAAGAGTSSARVAEVVCAGGAAAITALVSRGVVLDRAGRGWARGLEAAHGHHRVLHAGGDATGPVVSAALVAAALAVAAGGARLRLVEHAALADLVVLGDRVVGVDLLVGARGDRVRLVADAVVLATGGAGQAYALTTNPVSATGGGVAAAWRAGAVVADPEMVQFHPTAAVVGGGPPASVSSASAASAPSAPSVFLVSEAVRGEGAVLRDEGGRRYLLEGPLAHPLAELAPRDVVARATAAAMAAQDGRPVLLDATGVAAALGGRLDGRFPGIDALCRAAGIDWTRRGVPVSPAAHYWMGGVHTDGSGRTTVPGLWAVGEVACTGLHGANRLASNSLLEAAVLAARAAADIASGGIGAAELAGPVRGLAGEAAAVDRGELQRLMWERAGLLRDAAGLELAAKTLEGPAAADPVGAVGAATPTPVGAGRPCTDHVGAGTPSVNGGQGGEEGEESRTARTAQVADPLLALEDANLATVARLVVAGALARTESRGAHHRTDHPATDTLACRTLLRRVS